MSEASCPEKPELKEEEQRHNKRVLIILSAVLGLIIVIGGLLDLLARGVELGFTIPFLNVGTLSGIVYTVSVLAAALYIGIIGLKELIGERRVSLEVLMGGAAFGAPFPG